jgi:hypothetical protein
MNKDWTPLTREQLDTIIARSSKAPHLLPIYRAVRDYGLRLMIVSQTHEPFLGAMDEMGAPFIALIADDTDRTVGPGHFHQDSLRRLASAIDSAAVVASAPPVEAYAAMTMMPVLFGASTVIVETRPEQEIPWVEFLRDVQPNLPLILATVHGGHA